MIERTEVCWIDRETGNCWTFAVAATEEQAAAFAATLTNCENCSNCVNCTGCVECHECYGCTGCTACHTCTCCEVCEDCDCCIDCEQCIQCLGCRGCEKCTDCSDCEACVQCTSCIGSAHSSECSNCCRLYCCFQCSNCTEVHGLTDASENPMRITGPATLPQDEQLTVYVNRDGRKLFVHALARSEDKDEFLATLKRKQVDTMPLQVFLHDILNVTRKEN